jgi:predicted ArsR family transcriptional regulator
MALTDREKLSSVPSGPSATPGDVLAQPTRARLFQRLVGHARPVGTGELAADLGLHPSGVRVHLERLRDAGLVSRELIAQTKGRPRHGWQIATDARPGGEPPDAYRLLARWLARSIPSRPTRLREVERAGRELGRELAPKRGRSGAEETMGRTLTALGFAPQRDRENAGQVVFKLGSCPYRDAVRENQPVVCALHRGLTRGLLDELAPSARLTSFVPKDPDRAGCLIEVTGLERT